MTSRCGASTRTSRRACRAQYDFSIPDTVPEEPFDRSLFGRTRLETLDDKPSCQKSYRDAYSQFMQPSFASNAYYRLYYRLHADVDRHLGEVMTALEATRFPGNTIVVFTSDHGDLLGAHGGLHQKWYMAYEEAVRVPLVVTLPGKALARTVPIPTSHIDVAPTILGLAGLDHNERPHGHCAGLHRSAAAGRARSLAADPRRGRRGEVRRAYLLHDRRRSEPRPRPEEFHRHRLRSVAQPNHVESIIAMVEGETWKFSRYFDHPRYWSAPGTPGADGVRDVVD